MDNLTTGPSRAADDNRLVLERQLCFALYSASQAMTRLYKPLLKPLGLTYPQYLVMMVLWEDDDVTISAMGDRLMLDSGTLTPLVKRLETAGLLRRQRDPMDERKVRITLTKAGTVMRRQAETIPQMAASATGCEITELDSLTTRITRLRDSIAGDTKP